MIALSTVCLLVAIHNIYRYLIKDGRWHVLLLSLFYGSLVFMLIFQIWNASAVIAFYSTQPGCSILNQANQLDTCAVYSAIIFGVVQATNITELLIFTK